MRFVKQRCDKDARAKLVLFSQYMHVLEEVERVLNAYSIKCAVLKGTASQRHKIMQSFQIQYNKKHDGQYSNAHRVLLLSSKWAASGCDLHLGTHVFLLDPYNGSESQAYAAEKQAIGRTVRQGSKKLNCKVMRFVTKGSVEEDTYLRNMRKSKENAQKEKRRRRKLREQAMRKE